jgi:hypothetical protein
MTTTRDHVEIVELKKVVGLDEMDKSVQNGISVETPVASQPET